MRNKLGRFMPGHQMKGPVRRFKENQKTANRQDYVSRDQIIQDKWGGFVENYEQG